MEVSPDMKKLAATLRSTGLAASDSQAMRLAMGISETGEKTHKYFQEQTEKITKDLAKKHERIVSKYKKPVSEEEVMVQQNMEPISNIQYEEPKANDINIVNNNNVENNYIERNITIDRTHGDWELIGSFKVSENKFEEIQSNEIHTKEIETNEIETKEIENQAQEEVSSSVNSNISTPNKQQTTEEEMDLLQEDSNFIYNDSREKEVNEVRVHEMNSSSSNFEPKIEEKSVSQNSNEPKVDLSEMFNFSKR